MNGKWKRDANGHHHLQERAVIHIVTETEVEPPERYEIRTVGEKRLRQVSGPWTFRARASVKSGMAIGPWLCREAMGRGGAFHETKRLAKAKAQALARELIQDLMEPKP